MRLLIEIRDGVGIDGFMPNAILGSQYSAQLRASNAYLPLRWRVVGGALPDDWDIDPMTGLVTGSADDPGAYEVTIELRDGRGRFGRRTFRFRVAAAPLVIAGTLPNAQIGDVYNVSLTVSGGARPYATALVVTGPAWMTATLVQPDQIEVSGTASAAGADIPVVIRLIDADSVIANFSTAITVGYAPLVVTGAFSDTPVGSPLVGSPLIISGGLAPYSVGALPISGTRPDGVTIGVSGSNIVATGNTTTVASYAWTDRVTSADGQHVDVASSAVIAPLAFPEHLATYDYRSNGIFVTSHVINVAGSQSGDLLIIIIGCASNRTITAPTGWTSHGTTVSGSIRMSVFSSVLASATTSVTLTSGSTGATAQVVRVAAGTFDPSGLGVALSAHASATNHAVPTLSPPWGTDRTLWVAGINFASVGSPRGISDYPLPGQPAQILNTSSGSTVADTATCSAGIVAGTLTPGDYVIFAANASITALIAIKPA